jgi:hypothetical protein
VLFNAGLEAFSVLHFVLKVPTKYSCGSLTIEEMPPLFRIEDCLVNNRVYLQLWHAHGDINVTKGRLSIM